MKRYILYTTTLAFALTGAVQAAADRSADIRKQAPPPPQATDHAKVGSDLQTIDMILANVNSPRSAAAATQRLTPMVNDLSVQFRHDEARRALSPADYARLDANAKALRQRIEHLRTSNYYSSIKLARLCNTIMHIIYPIAPPA